MRRLLAMFAIAVGVLTVPSIAFAQGADSTNAEAAQAVVGKSFFELPPLFVGPLLATFLPLLIALLTKASTPGWVKGVGLALLTAVTTLLTSNATEDGGAVLDAAAGMTFLVSFATAIAVHYGIWKPTVTTPLQNTGIKD